MEENQVEEKKGWSWLGFFFAPHYYAGYGDVKKGVIYALIGAFPLFGLIIAIISGRNARKELPIGKQDFNWKNVVLTVCLTVASGLTMQSIFSPNQEVETIKQSKLKMCPTATVEEMVNSFFGDPSWKSDVTDNGVKFVNIGGDMTYSDKPVRGVIQFTFSKDETSFEYQAFEINGIPQNQLIAGELLQKMCDSTK